MTTPSVVPSPPPPLQPFSSSSSSSSSSPAGIDSDWYGNTRIHHLVGNRYPDRPDTPSLIALLEANPSAASVANQFNRIPLHYALDRCKADYEAVQILCQKNPEGVIHRDYENNSPFDLAIKWKHPKEIMRLLIKNNPAVARAYPTLCLTLTYGRLLATMIKLLVGSPVVVVENDRMEEYRQARGINMHTSNQTDDEQGEDGGVEYEILRRSVSNITDVSTSSEGTIEGCKVEVPS